MRPSAKGLSKKKTAAKNSSRRKAFKEAAVDAAKVAVESVALRVGRKTPKRRVTFEGVDSKGNTSPVALSETNLAASAKRVAISGIIESKKRHREEEKEEEADVADYSDKDDDGESEEVESVDSSANGSGDDLSDLADSSEGSDEEAWENPFEKAKREGTRLSYEALRLRFLPPEFQEPQLFKFFSQFGAQVLNCFCVRSRRTHQSKGIAYVQFDNPSVLPVVVEECHGMSLGGRAVQAHSITLHRAMPSKEKTAHRRRLAYIHKTQGARLSRHDVREKDPVAALIKYSRAEKANNQHLKRLGIDYEFNGFATQLANVPKGLFIYKARKNSDKNSRLNGKPKSGRGAAVKNTVVSSSLSATCATTEKQKKKKIIIALKNKEKKQGK